MQKWEYFKLDVFVSGGEEWYFNQNGKQFAAQDSLISVMNEMGQNGWELIEDMTFDITNMNGHTRTNRYMLLFKHPA